MNGISIDTLTLPKIKIDQLYIKLDKKLIVTIDTLTIEKATKTDSSLEEISTILENFAYINQFFSRIAIQHIIYDNETFSLTFNNDLFAFESQHLNLIAHIIPIDKWRFSTTIEEAYLKDYDVHVKGETQSNIQTQAYSFDGNFDTFGLKGHALLDLNQSLLTYHLSSEKFDNKSLSDLMNFLVTQIELEPIIKAWIHENIVVAKEYFLDNLEGKVNIQTGEYFPLEMKGHAHVHDALISFEPSVPAAHADSIGITLDQDKLLFDISHPVYESTNIQKANVFIYNLLTKGTGIVVDLTTKAKLDDKIHKILHAFNIDVPITQTSGLTDASIKLDIHFLPYAINAQGLFKLSKSNFLLSNLPMSTNSGEISLDNFMVTLDHANMRYKDLFDLNATGVFDTQKGHFDGKIDINTLLLDFSGNTLLDAHLLMDQNGSFDIDDDTTHINLPKLGTTILFGKDSNTFKISDLSLLKTFSPFMQEHNLSMGSLNVQTTNFKTYDAAIKLDNVSTPFFDHDQSLNHLDIALSTDTKTLDAYTLDHKLSLQFNTDILLHVKDLDLHIPEGNTSLNIPIKTTILGENSNIIDANSSKIILSERYSLILYKDQITLHSSRGKSSFDYEKKQHSLNINATALDDNATNALFNRHYFKKGNFSLTVEGKDDTHMQGTFIMHKTYTKDFKFFSNLMATINAIPSLLVFSDPNFDQEGYFVDNGYIEFKQVGEILHISELQLRGQNADIVGSGDIDFASRTLNLKLQIKTLKTFSSALDMIPLVSGLILGEDKRISTNVDVTGSLDDPEVETHLILDTLKSPVNIIKRTLELPFGIFK